MICILFKNHEVILIPLDKPRSVFLYLDDILTIPFMFSPQTLGHTNLVFFVFQTFKGKRNMHQKKKKKETYVHVIVY